VVVHACVENLASVNESVTSQRIEWSCARAWRTSVDAADRIASLRWLGECRVRRVSPVIDHLGSIGYFDNRAGRRVATVGHKTNPPILPRVRLARRVVLRALSAGTAASARVGPMRSWGSAVPGGPKRNHRGISGSFGAAGSSLPPERQSWRKLR